MANSPEGKLIQKHLIVYFRVFASSSDTVRLNTTGNVISEYLRRVVIMDITVKVDQWCAPPMSGPTTLVTRYPPT